MKQKNLIDECIAEFLGTGILIFFGVGCVAALVLAGAQLGQWEVSLIWGLGVAIAIYVTGGVSGAHLNPAVTLALFTQKGFEKKKVVPFICSQLVGAFSSAALVFYMYRNLFAAFEKSNGIIRGSVESLATAGIFSTYPHEAIDNLQAFSIETIITGVLMMAILALGDEKNMGPKGNMAPLLIGILISIIGASMGPLTGFAMNPARDFGPKLFAYLAGWGSIAFTGGLVNPYFWVPILGPICGAQLGALIYGRWIEPNLEDKKEVKVVTN